MSRLRRLAAVAFTALLIFEPLTALGASVILDIKPADAVRGKIQVGGFVFEIAAHTAGGSATFDISITEAGGTFNDDSPNLSLSRRDHDSLSPVRALEGRRQGHTAACHFDVAANLLNDPEVVFLFANPTVVLMNGQPDRMPSAQMFVVHLSDFLKH